MAPDPVKLGQEIVARCTELGFAQAGIADAAPTRWGAELAAWLAAGKHGCMDYMSEQLQARLDPTLILAGARSVIMVADLYSSRGQPPEDPAPHGRGRIARYVRGRDYHATMKSRLHRLSDALREEYPGAEFRTVVDTAPLLEREYAARAGLGWIGKHTLLIHPRLGSYMLLGGVLTTLELRPPLDHAPTPDHCGTCTRCIDACPTHAITPHSVDATRCISYLTIEHREAIDPALHAGMGPWLYGCDVCQEVCPHNSVRPAEAAPGPNPAYAHRRDSFDLLEVLGWSEPDRRAAFSTTALKRATLAMMKRNALIVAANTLAGSDNPPLRARIAELAADPREPALVRETAAAVLRGLEGPGRVPGRPAGPRAGNGPDATGEVP